LTYKAASYHSTAKSLNGDSALLITTFARKRLIGHVLLLRPWFHVKIKLF